MHDPPTLSFEIRGPIAHRDLPGLSDRICRLLDRSGARTAVAQVVDVEPDAVTVDALARLQLAAGRYGCRVRLRGVSPELRSLIAFMGLTDVLPE